MKICHPILAAVGIALASCQSVPDPAPATTAPAPYKALGTEPFWSLTINGRGMIFNHDEEIAASDVKARPSINGWRYTSSIITADVTFTECSDGMSEYTYKDSVTVMVGKREYKGCGGGILPPEKFDGTSWQVVSINGLTVERERNAMINFADGRMSGGVGCNRLSANYKFADRKLSFGSVMSTKMACPDPVGQQEYIFVNLLGSLLSAAFPGDGTLVLAAKDGSTATLRQSM